MQPILEYACQVWDPYILNNEHNTEVCVINQEAKANNIHKPRAALFSKKKELPWVRFKPRTLRFLGMSALPTELPGQPSW